MMTVVMTTLLQHKVGKHYFYSAPQMTMITTSLEKTKLGRGNSESGDDNIIRT